MLIIRAQATKRCIDWNNDYIDLIADDAGRTMMGSHQENWFYDQLSDSSDRGATWRVIGSQVVFSELVEGDSGGDSWSVSHRLSTY